MFGNDACLGDGLAGKSVRALDCYGLVVFIILLAVVDDVVLAGAVLVFAQSSVSRVCIGCFVFGRLFRCYFGIVMVDWSDWSMICKIGPSDGCAGDIRPYGVNIDGRALSRLNRFSFGMSLYFEPNVSHQVGTCAYV